MRFSAITTLSLLLASLIAAHNTGHGHSSHHSSHDIDARDMNDLQDRDLDDFSEYATYSEHHVKRTKQTPLQNQQHMEYIKGMEHDYNHASAQLDHHHATGASHDTLRDHHKTMAGLADSISKNRHHVNDHHHTNGPGTVQHSKHKFEANRWAQTADMHRGFAAAHHKAGGHKK